MRRRDAGHSTHHSGSQDRPPRRVRPEREDPPWACRSRNAARTHLWTWAGVGAVIGGGVVFAALSAARLKRDVSPASPPVAAAWPAAGEDDDALAALAAHQKASARELKSLLASQQTVWRLFATTTAAEIRPLITEGGRHSLPADGVHSPLTGVTLSSKRRLPEEAGTASQWTVATTRFGELVVEVTDTTGQPRVHWDHLATQLGAPDLRTAAAP